LVKLPRLLRRILLTIAVILVVVAILFGSAWLYFHPQFTRTNAVAYAQRNGRPLSFDLLRPAKPNGAAVIVIVSGGWKSARPGSFPAWVNASLMRRGYTIFAVYHISQPEETVMNTVQDIHRAVRFIRHHAHDYGIDPRRIGVTGGSAGGHLSLMLATRGDPGPTDAPDPVDRESSAVQAVAIFFPVTDLLNLGNSTENLGDGGPPKSFVRAFGPQSTNLSIWKQIGRDVSPIYFITTNLPPILILHGDKDTLVPLDQSRRFHAKAREIGCNTSLLVHRGGEHGWGSMILDIRRFADWFDRYLTPVTP
jgi:acetyl esterase/lipase